MRDTGRSRGSAPARSRRSQESRHPNQIEGGHREGELEAHALQSAHFGLRQADDRLAPAERLLDQRAIDREVIVGQEALDLGVTQHRFEQLGGNVGIEQPVAVLGERRMIPHGIIDTEPDEPAEQQVIVDLLHQLPHRVGSTPSA